MSKPRDPIRKPQSLRIPTVRALGLSTLAMMPVHLLAADSDGAAADAQQLSTIRVEEAAIDPNPNAQPGVPYKARTSGDERHTRPLAETPATVSVITRAAMDDGGLASLSQIVDAQPGITLGTGENGNAFGDRYIIRGQESRSDVFVDGLRDPGMTTRESFAIEQLEISKGPNSSFAGRGTSGGAINAITKQATTAYNFTRFSAGVGGDKHTRFTADINHSFGATFAVRGNALYGSEEIPERDPTDRERKGLALSGLYSPNDDLNVVIDYYGLRAHDNPDLGGYLEGTVPNRLPAKNVPVYAQQQDFQDSDVNTGTARINYHFSPNLRLVNLTRYGTSDNGYVVTGARSATTGANNPGGIYTTATLSTHQGWQDVKYLANQSNLFVDVQLAGTEHDFVLGVEFTDHKVLNGVYNVSNSGQNCITTGTTLNAWCVIAPGGGPVSGINTLMNRQITRGAWDQDWQMRSIGASLMDTFNITSSVALFAGVRADRFDYDLAMQSSAGLITPYAYSDTLWNGHVGLTYKLSGTGMIYGTVATAADANGGESDVGTNSGYGGVVIYNGSVAGAKPERSVNLELGTKWNLLDEKLLLTAAAFQSTKSDVMEGADYAAFGTFNTGRNRVRGVEFSATGNLTQALSGQIGLALMDSEVLASFTPANVGKVLSNFAENSLSALIKYEFSPDFALGGTGRYESRRYAGQPDTAAVYGSDGQYSQPIPAYAVFDLFASYAMNKNLDLRLNIGNVANKEYYQAGYRSGSFLYMGDGRTVRLTFNYEL